jgi:NADH-ubiquinone oxidoreductase chain 5
MLYFFFNQKKNLLNKFNIHPFVITFSFVLFLYFLFNFIQFNILSATKNLHILLYFIFLTPIILGFFSRLLGRTGVILYLVLGYTFILSFLQICVFTNLTDTSILNFINFGQWINTGNIEVKWEFIFDNISLTMLIIILLITFCVLLYSIGYLYEDPHLLRFLFYISFFSAFMVILVTANNFVVLFMGWEGVGICSYLLISFWFTRIKAVKAALKAVVMNRIGDTGVLMAMILSVVYFQTLDFTELLVLSNINYVSNIHTLVCHLICLCLFLGVIGKSAQMGLHTWLLLAMEGPTPASALIHAATMVTAGIFLIIRLSTLFSNAPGILILCTFVGSITSLFAGLCGLVQTDMKRIVAFSTTSQLGYMLLTCGLSHYSLAFFHLINHAFFKAMLFMTMGIIIHIITGEQDLRKTGGLLTIIPLVYTALQIGNSALTGFIFTTGFFSKDLILEITVLQHSFFIDSVTQQIALLTAVLTFLYSSRVVYYLFLNTNQIINKNYIHFSNDTSYLFMTIALIPLLIMSICFGFFFRIWFIGSTNIFENSVMAYNKTIEAHYLISTSAEILPFSIKNLPAFFCIALCFISLINFSQLHISLINQAIFTNNKNTNNFVTYFNNTQHFLYYRWYSDKFFDFVFFKILSLGQSFIIQIMERGILDIIQFGKKYSIVTSIKKVSSIIFTLENSNSQLYIGFIVISFFTLFILVSL